jgi:energy-coupling factor transporter ATP-binding protein EcfA2
MLKSLTIRNYQCHKNLKIDLDPQITIIVGSNDVGKSAIIRALRTLCLNRPSGKSCVRRSQTQSSIRLKVDNHVITRKIGKTNSYSLDGQVYKAFRSDVPPAIKRILSIAEINFQQQHEPVFWFSLTPGQTARELNGIIDLDNIDTVQTKITKRLRNKSLALAVCRERVLEARAMVDRTAWSQHAVVKLGKLQSDQTAYRTISHQMGRIALLCRSAGRYDHKRRSMSSAIPVAQAVDALGGRITADRVRLDRLGAVVDRLGAVQRAIMLLPSGWEPLGRLDRGNGQRREQIAKLQELLESLQEQEKCTCELQQRLKRKSEQAERKLGGRCPSCGGILTTRMKMY